MHGRLDSAQLFGTVPCIGVVEPTWRAEKLPDSLLEGLGRLQLTLPKDKQVPTQSAQRIFVDGIAFFGPGELGSPVTGV